MDYTLTLAVVCFVALSVGLQLLAVPATARNDRCRSEYTWRSPHGNEYGYEALNTEMCGSASTCGAKYPKPETVEDRPPKVDEDTVELSFFSIILDPSKNSTCLGISYTLNRYAADKIKGVQFLLNGLGYNSHNEDCCQVLNFTVELSYEAVVTNLATGELRIFTFDCFCDLWPLEPYELTIRTLPVDFDNQTLLDDSSIVKSLEVPGCDSREWDQYCQKSKEELWVPQLLKPQQLFPQYMELEVTFNIAPPDYRLVQYVITLYQEGEDRPMDTIVALLSEISFYPRVVNGLMMNVSSVIFTLDQEDVGKKVRATMFPRCAPGAPDCNTATHSNDVNIVEIIGNPCDADPCGELGECVPNETLYSCLCNEDAILDQHPTLIGDTCIDNPCYSNPCTILGSCGLDGINYYCNCTSGAINNGDTCIPDPCEPNPCDSYSTCRIDEEFQPECYCAQGVTCIVDECHLEDFNTSDCIIIALCEWSQDLEQGWKYHDCSCRNQITNSTNVTSICADDTCHQCDGCPCDAHVSCAYSDVQGGVRYNCSCADGYSFDEDGLCIENKTGYLWAIVIVAIFLLVLALFIGFRFVLKPRIHLWRKNATNEMLVSTSPSTTQELDLNNHPHDASTEQPQTYYVPVPNGPSSCHEPNSGPHDEADKKILIISTEESEEHCQVIYKFASFLQKHAGLITIIPSQNKTAIHDQTLEKWLINENRTAFKVLFICSQRMWEREKDSDKNNQVESEFGDVFITMMHITNHERHAKGTMNKFAMAFFSDCFSIDKVREMLMFGAMPQFELMADVEKLCFLLLGIEQYTPTSSRKMPNVKQYEKTPEGQALLKAIAEMKKNQENVVGKRGVPRLAIAQQHSQVSADSVPSPTSESLVSGPSALNSREGSEKSIEFREINEDEKQTMATVSGLFSPSYSDSDDDSSTSMTYHVDVHQENGEDSGFTQPMVDCGQVVLRKPQEKSDELDSGVSSLPTSPLSDAQYSIV